MYAVILTGGKQVKAEVGQTIYVEKLDGNEKDSVVFDKVLFVEDGNKTVLGKPFIDGAKVTGEIVKQGKGPKIHVLRYKAKSNLRVRHGHRQAYTAVAINAIDVK